MQALYAYFLLENNIDVAEKNLLQRIEKIYDLFLYQLQAIVDIADFARRRMEDAKTKYLPTPEELNPNKKFLDNKVIRQIETNTNFINYTSKKRISFQDEYEMIRTLFLTIKDSEEFIKYMHSPVNTYEGDKKFIQILLKNYILDFPDFQNFFEEKNISWSDDFDIAATMVLKYISSLTENIDTSSPLPDLYKKVSDENQDEDKEYVIRLFRKTIINHTFYEELISAKTKNWEAERIAVMDFLLMKMALCEILEFPTIPVKVTLNEYIDIAKEYSTPNSKIFINGILDKLVFDLKNKNKINKTGRGLQE